MCHKAVLYQPDFEVNPANIDRLVTAIHLDYNSQAGDMPDAAIYPQVELDDLASTGTIGARLTIIRFDSIRESETEDSSPASDQRSVARLREISTRYRERFAVFRISARGNKSETGSLLWC